jgi:hypothetical protein
MIRNIKRLFDHQTSNLIVYLIDINCTTVLIIFCFIPRARTKRLKQIADETLVQTEDQIEFSDGHGFRSWTNFAWNSYHWEVGRKK